VSGPVLAAECAERTFARGTADGAGENGVLLAGTAIEQVTAVGAEDEGANGRHVAIWRRVWGDGVVVDFCRCCRCCRCCLLRSVGRRLGKKEPGFISRGASARWADLGKRSNATNPSAPESCQSRAIIAVPVQVQLRGFNTAARYHVFGRDSARLGHGYVLLVSATIIPRVPVALLRDHTHASACPTSSALRPRHYNWEYHVRSSAGRLAQCWGRWSRIPSAAFGGRGSAVLAFHLDNTLFSR
jgi:hypothetical protein